MKVLNKTLLFAVILITVFLILNTTAKIKQEVGLSISEKVLNLMDMNNKKALLRFNGQKFREYVKNSPRNYSMIVMFTTIASFHQCQICKDAHDEFQIVAQSYRFSPIYSNKLFFAMVDFDDGSDVFQMLRLNIVPVLMHFPANGKPNGADTMDIQRVGFAAKAIAKFVATRTGVHIRVLRPLNYSGTVAMVTLAALVVGFLYMRRYNLEFLDNKSILGAIAVFFCFTMISGQMRNHIRGPPLVHKSQNGGVAYIHGSSQDALIFFGMILLIDAGSQTDQRKGRIMAIVGLAFLAIFFSFLLSVFRVKAQDYPYSLLFK